MDKQMARIIKAPVWLDMEEDSRDCGFNVVSIMAFPCLSPVSMRKMDKVTLTSNKAMHEHVTSRNSVRIRRALGKITLFVCP